MIEIEPETPSKTSTILKTLLCVCLLASVVWVIYKARKPRPEPSELSPAKFSGANLADSQEVQDRLHQDISDLVGNPPPFEEEDEKLRQQLDAQTNSSAPVTLDTLPLESGNVVGHKR